MCVCVGGEGKERSTRVERLLSASQTCGRPAAMQALAYWSLTTKSPLQVVCVSCIQLCIKASKVKQTNKAKQHSTPKAVKKMPRVGLEPTTHVHVQVGANACSLWGVVVGMSWSCLPSHVLSQLSGE